jgi:hypothetical protein
MKTKIRLGQASLAGLLAFTLLLAKTDASAQEQTATPGQERGELAAALPAVKFDLEVVNGGIVEMASNGSYNFEGAGTVAGLVDYLRKKDTNVNYILRAGVGDVRLADFKLHSVDIATVLSVLPELTDQSVTMRSMSGGGPRGGGGLLGGAFGGGGGAGGFGGGGGRRGGGVFGVMNGTIVVLSLLSQQNLGGFNTTRRAEVFNINGYLATLAANGHRDQKGIEEALGQVEKLVVDTLQRVKMRDLRPNEEIPGFEFHRGTGLLIVVGAPDAIDVATQVINALPGQTRDGSGRIGNVINVQPQEPANEPQPTSPKVQEPGPAAGTNR